MHRQFSARNEDAGFTLIEVVVAMLVFAIIATGFLMTLTASLVTTRDTRARIVAANLAAQQVDLIRSQNAIDLPNTSREVTLNGDTFTVDVKWSWQTSTGGATTCEPGVATGALLYKRVTVEVSWNARDGLQRVFSDTALAPRTKISDQALGTILVGVVDAAGAGVGGVIVSLTPASGVASVTTDSDGCAYLLKVPPATNYSVSISKSGYVNEQQKATPSASVSLAAGTTSRASFAFDKATNFKTTYVNAKTNATLAAGSLPTNLATTFVSTYGTFPSITSSSANPQTFARYPISSGYSIMAGSYAETPAIPATTCLAPDPGEWAETSTLVGHRPAAVAGLGGATVAVNVPMGVVTLASAGTNSQKYLTAVYVGGGAGDPGCAVATTYKFGSILTTSGSVTAALPPGTWKLYRGSSAGETSGSTGGQITSGITVATSGAVSGTGVNTVVVIDPRVSP